MMENGNLDQSYLALATRLVKEDLNRSHPESHSETPILIWHCNSFANREYVFSTPKAEAIHTVTYDFERAEWHIARYVKAEDSLIASEFPDGVAEGKTLLAAARHSAKGA